MNEAIALLERISGRTLDVSRGSRPSRATSGARAPTRRASARSSAGSRGSRSRTGSARQWEWASTRVGAAMSVRPRISAPSARSTSGAGATRRSPLVDRRRRARRRRRRRRDLLAERRAASDQASALIAPGQPFSPSGVAGAHLPVEPACDREHRHVRVGRSNGRPPKARMPLERAARPRQYSDGRDGCIELDGRAAARSLIEITVQLHKTKRGRGRRERARGRSSIADTTSSYVRQSIATYQRRIEELQRAAAVAHEPDRHLNKALASARLDFARRSWCSSSQLDAATLRQGNLNDKLATTEQQLTLAQNVEIAQIIEHGGGREDDRALAPQLGPRRRADRADRRRDRGDRRRRSRARRSA